MVDVPVHTCCPVVIDMQPIHTGISISRLQISCKNQRQGNKLSAIAWPALYDGYSWKGWLCFKNHLLTRRMSNGLWGKFWQRHQHVGNEFDLVNKGWWHFGLYQSLNLLSNFIHMLNVERHGHAFVRAKCIYKHRHRIAFYIFKEKGRPVRLGDTIGNFCYL